MELTNYSIPGFIDRAFNFFDKKVLERAAKAVYAFDNVMAIFSKTKTEPSTKGMQGTSYEVFYTRMADTLKSPETDSRIII